MELGSDTTFQEERAEVLASVRDAMRTGGRDPGLQAAAGFLLRHLTEPSSQQSAVSYQLNRPRPRALRFELMAES